MTAVPLRLLSDTRRSATTARSDRWGLLDRRSCRGVRHAAVRLRRSASARSLPRSRCCLRARARRLRHQGVPLQGDGPARATTRACCSTSHPAANWPWRWPPVCRPTHARCTATTSRSTNCARRIGRRAPHRRRLLRRARPARRARRERGVGPRRRSCCASRPACRRTPTSSSPPARTTRSSVSTSATAMRSRRSTAPVVSRVGRPRRRALPHRFERVRRVVVREGGRGDGRLRRPARPPRTGPRRWARCRRTSRVRKRRRSHSGATCCSTRARRSACGRR